ncbi:MAG: phage tail protein [Peptococcaceae bacterium]|nr:phage tail protein [Peptococcaceae bacterium]
MGAFGGLILTNKGRNLQAKAQTGVQLNFTKVKIGDGSLSGQSIVDLTDLINTKKELTILGLETLTGGKAKLSSYFSNADIVTGFYWRELGIFAQDPQEGEILYCYGNAGANAEYIPAGGGTDIVERYIRVITLIGNASNISATLGSEIYVTQAEFDTHAGRHASAGADPLTPADIGAETPAGAQAKADAVQANLAAHLAETMPHKFTDGTTTYRWGLAVIDGVVNMVYEEVV